MKKQPSTPAANEWSQLAIFRIYKDIFPDHQPTLGIFNNTRQQCIVRITVAGLDSVNNKVPIPQADLDKIELIDYVTGTPLTKVDTFDDHPEWAYSTKHQGYEWDESKILGTAHDSESLEHVAGNDGEKPADGPSSTPPDQQLVTYYVSTRSHSTRQIAARIPKGNTWFRTNVNVDDPDGKGNGSGSFNSSVHIRPVDFPSLPSGDYGDVSSAGTLLPNKVGSSTYFYWATEYFLHVKLMNELLRLKSVSGSDNHVEPAGFAVYMHGGGNDNAKWGISYYGQPGDSAPEHFPLEPLATVNVLVRHGEGNATHDIYKPMDMFRTCVGSIVNASKTRVVIGLLTGNIAAEFLDKSGKKVNPVTCTTLHIMDVYGNDHALSLAFGDKATDLRITKI